MISSCIITLNEEKNIPRLMESLKDCDEIIIADGGSTDKTVELAKEKGVDIYSRSDTHYIPTQEDIDRFQTYFGYAPSFTLSSVFLNMSEIRNDVIKRAKNDWIFFPDADEIVSWDREELEELMQSADQISCNLIQDRDAEGNPTHWNSICKLFRKDKCQWSGRTHEVIVGGEKKVTAKSMKIDHYKTVYTQSNVLPTLEYAVLKDADTRSLFYLGREYFYYKRYKEAIEMCNRYIAKTTWLPEKVEALYIKAQCLWQTGQGDEARRVCGEAVKNNPDCKKVLEFMGEVYNEPWKHKWKRLASSATNEDVLFV